MSTPTKPQSMSTTGKKWLPVFQSRGASLPAPKKGDQNSQSAIAGSLPQANHSTETVVGSYHSRGTQGTQNGKVPRDTSSTDSYDTAVQPQIPTHNTELEWPQDGVLAQINVGGKILSLISLDGGPRTAMICVLDKRNRLQSWNADNGQLMEIEPPLAEGSMVNAIAASKDGKQIVTTYQDGRVVIWDATRDPIIKVGEFKAGKGDRREESAIDISPDSSSLAIGSEDGRLVIWSIGSKRCVLGPLQHQNSTPISSVKFSPSGGRIASGHLNATEGTSVYLWHSRTGDRLESVRNQHSTYSLAWSVDGSQLFAGSSGGSIKCLDILTRTSLPELVLHPTSRPRDLINSTCVSNSGQFLASISHGRTNAIDIWDISHVSRKSLRSRYEVQHVSISPDSSHLVSAGKDNHSGYHVTSWNISTLLDRNYLLHRLSPSAIDQNPFTHVSYAVLEAWKKGDLEEAEEKLGNEIRLSDETHDSPQDLYPLVNRALVRVRRKDWAGALNDVIVVKGQPDNRFAGLVAYIVEGIALHGQGKCKEALASFRLALHSDIFKCIKSITLLEHHEGPCPVAAEDDLPCGDLRRLVEARKALLRARGEMRRKGYEEALKCLQPIPNLFPLLHLVDVKTISLLFDWDLVSLISDIHELRCRALFESDQAPEQSGALKYFAAGQTELSEELEAVQAKLSSLSEEFGDQELSRREAVNWEAINLKAIGWYSESLKLAGCPSLNDASECRTSPGPGASATLRSRCPQSIAGLLAKRSKVKANLDMWSDALTDAARAIEDDPSSPQGYERKFVALHAQQRFKEACTTLKIMASRFMDPYAPEILQMRNYTETIGKIDKLINAIFDKSPFVVIDVQTGLLRDQKERRDMFESDSRYYELVSSMSTKLDISHIEEVVEDYFDYVMFSHTWDGEDEPSFELVTKTPVYNLLPSPQNKKLQKFCETIQEGGSKERSYQWAWSDTCCIDKKNPDVFEKSIRFMYKWYHNSALTLVRLADPSRSTPRDSPRLEHNRWMFRAWTLQELLAPRDVRFYRHNWDLYLDCHTNHKAAPEIMGELTTSVKDDTILQRDFSPDSLTVRERLQLASTREATKKVDIAYALIGIFSSDIHVDNHREGDIALGLLLQEIVNRQGDVTVLDWTGQPSQFNSSIPADISVYKPEPYKLPSITNDMISQRAKEANNAPLREEVTGLHDLLYTLGLPRFADRRLSLPCITFSVSEITHDTSRTPRDPGMTAYIASTAALGKVQFETRDPKLPSNLAKKSPEGRVVLVYPWIRDLLAQIRRRGRNKHDRVMSLIVYLEQGFRALLFAEQSDQQYKRVATETEITVPKLELTSLEDVGAEMLEVWERS